MQYFLIKNHAATGPFPKEQLLENGLTQNSLVWHEGLPDWVKAIEIEELQDIFFKKKDAPVKISKVRVVITASIAVLLVVAVIVMALMLQKANTIERNDNTVVNKSSQVTKATKKTKNLHLHSAVAQAQKIRSTTATLKEL